MNGASPQGEVGILKEIRYQPATSSRRMFIVMEYRGAEYIGCLLLDDGSFCGGMAKFLQRCCGQSIVTVGSSDIASA
jgi:hypothetical protein